MRFAKVIDGKITNVIESDLPLNGWIMVPATANIGYILVNGEWARDPASIPSETLDDYKSSVKNKLEAISTKKLRKIIGEDTHEEALSVLISWLAADAITANAATAAQTAMLTNEATRRNKTLNNIVTALITDFAAVQDKIGHIRGITKETKHQITQALTVSDVDVLFDAARTAMNSVLNGD